MLLQLPFIVSQENLYKNVNEIHILCKNSCICNFAIIGSDFHEIFAKMQNGNDIHHFGKFLLIFELGKSGYLAPNQA